MVSQSDKAIAKDERRKAYKKTQAVAISTGWPGRPIGDVNPAMLDLLNVEVTKGV